MSRSLSSPALGAELDLTIERLLINGSGLARVDGRVVFVPGGLPGDELRVRVVRHARRHVEAEVVEVRRPSPDRRAARCAHFGTCGGCALQDLAYPAQLEAKKTFVLDALRARGGPAEGVEVEVIGSPEYGWRARAELRVVPGAGDGPRLGYLRARTHDVLAVGACPVLVPDLESELLRLSTGVLAWPAGTASVHLAAGDARVARAHDDARGRPLDAEPEIVQRVANRDLRLGARSFFQANRPLLETLVARATGGATGGLAVDLYAGSGLFALALAPRFEAVLAVEVDAAAAERARRNAEDVGLAHVSITRADASEWLRRAQRLAPDLLVLDPPRSGAGPEVIDGIANLGPAEIRYVSCDPGTLARDLERLRGHGYGLRSLAILDLFPQTLHVETVAVLAR